jgi:hypothetical protein
MRLAQKQTDDEQNIEHPDMNPCSYGHLIFDKGPNHLMEKRQPLQQMLLGKQDMCIQETETRPMALTLYKYQLKSGLRTLM